MDPSLIDALKEAVERDPGNRALRLHLADLLEEAGRSAEALEQAMAVLSGRPDDVEALRVASRAAEAVGDTARADGFRRVADALGAEAGSGEGPGSSKPEASGSQAPAPDKQDDPDEAFREIVSMSLGGEDPGSTTTEEYLRSDWEVERPNITLADVAGMDDVKRRLNVAFLGPLRNPELMKTYGKSLRGGLLLYGPPGCGKTFIARATAGEMGSRFIVVGLSDVLDMWLGESERKLHEIFELARRNAPCVLFFDEIDAIGQKRSQLRTSGGLRNVVAQLLAEFDGMEGSNDGVFVLGATNHPWDVDTALRRPGRFDRTTLVLPPDEPAREAILRFHLRGRPAQDVDVARVAHETDDFSGADLAHLCESAAELAMEDSMSTGQVRSMSADDFKRSMREVHPSTRPWFEIARNYAMFANEGGMYDDLLAYIKARKI